MFIRLSKLLMGKHALAGKAEQTGEVEDSGTAHGARLKPWLTRSPVPHTILWTFARTACSDGKCALPATAAVFHCCRKAAIERTRCCSGITAFTGPM
jgi:hypothetical protein